jgi:hypothetical protein
MELMISPTFESSFGSMKVIWERSYISKQPLGISEANGSLN